MASMLNIGNEHEPHKKFFQRKKNNSKLIPQTPICNKTITANLCGGLIAVIVVISEYFGSALFFFRATRSLSFSFLIDKVIKTSVHEIEKMLCLTNERTKKNVVCREPCTTNENR